MALEKRRGADCTSGYLDGTKRRTVLCVIWSPRDTWYSMKIDWFLEGGRDVSDGLDLPDHHCRGAILLRSSTKSTVAGRFLHNLGCWCAQAFRPVLQRPRRFLTEFKMRKGNPLECSSWTSQEVGILVGYTHCVHSRLGRCNPAIHHVKGSVV